MKLFGLLLVVIFSVVCLASANSDDRESQFLRGKRDHGHGITGPVHTFVKTDKHANFKWGVRHHVGHQYAGRR